MSVNLRKANNLRIGGTTAISPWAFSEKETPIVTPERFATTFFSASICGLRV